MRSEKISKNDMLNCSKHFVKKPFSRKILFENLLVMYIIYYFYTTYVDAEQYLYKWNSFLTPFLVRHSCRIFRICSLYIQKTVRFLKYETFPGFERKYLLSTKAVWDYQIHYLKMHCFFSFKLRLFSFFFCVMRKMKFK